MVQELRKAEPSMRMTFNSLELQFHYYPSCSISISFKGIFENTYVIAIPFTSLSRTLSLKERPNSDSISMLKSELRHASTAAL
jgi:hypothetical protein